MFFLTGCMLGSGGGESFFFSDERRATAIPTFDGCATRVGARDARAKQIRSPAQARRVYEAEGGPGDHPNGHVRNHVLELS